MASGTDKPFADKPAPPSHAPAKQPLVPASDTPPADAPVKRLDDAPVAPLTDPNDTKGG
jgi:hypothetical protein